MGQGERNAVCADHTVTASILQAFRHQITQAIHHHERSRCPSVLANTLVIISVGYIYWLKQLIGFRVSGDGF